jgi:hypothetical protein
MTPEKLSMRAVNQYRSRDILAYLGLRYYFDNQCAHRDHWASEVATHLTLSRNVAGYFQSRHFKERLESGEIMHRDIFLPGPNEIYAEAALLSECGKHIEFKSLDCVFSYALVPDNETRGIYNPYFAGLQERHRKIADACRGDSNFVVQYTDIKRFYPSISAEVARNAWMRACSNSELPPKYRDLGLKLLLNHAEVSAKHQHGKGLLTGPMFSHLIANLVLQEVDQAMSMSFPGRYFRYVDDVILVGTNAQVSSGREALSTHLVTLGLELHASGNGKDFQVKVDEWLQGESDFDDSASKNWMTFSRNLKQFLITQPHSINSLSQMFSTQGFRLPLPDYEVAVRDAQYQQRFSDSLRRHPWLLKTIFRQTAPDNLLQSAVALRDGYSRSLSELLESDFNASGYQRKRIIPKIRYFAGRLLYLGKAQDLIKFGDKLFTIPELYMLAEIITCVATRDVTRLLPLGSNAVQSAAQVLKLDESVVSCNIGSWGAAERQGLAILRANGINVSGPIEDELNQFVVWQETGQDLMESHDLFLQEIACLHGVSKTARHKTMLNSVFGRQEELAFDATTPIETY